MPNRIYSEVIAFARKIVSGLALLPFYYFDCWLQKVRLTKYDDGIVRNTPCSPIDSNDFCIFVYFEPSGVLSPSVNRVVSTLRQCRVNVVLVCNHELSSEQTGFFEVNCHSLICRTNQGFDFGAYKDAVSFLSKSEFQVDRLGLMNDSVFYASSGLEDLVKLLYSSDEDCVAAFENWGEGHHIQSFCLSVSGDVFRSQQFQTFWRNYVPINNRRYAIEYGEKKLSSSILSSANSSSVIYSVSKLPQADLLSKLEYHRNSIWVPATWRSITGGWGKFIKDGVVAERDEQELKEFSIDFLNILNATSPVHAGAYVFPKLLGCPIYKKDLVYRGRFNFWEIEVWLAELLPPDELLELLHLLRSKSVADRLGFWDRVKYNVGVK